MPPTSIDYLRAHLEEALATDGRVSEQGLHVDVAGGVLVVRGYVSTEQRRAAVDAIAGEVASGVAVRNEVSLVPLDEPDGEERVG